MSDLEIIRAVLEQHPLEAGKDFYAGTIVCTGCHWVLGDPTDHLIQALIEALTAEGEPVSPPAPKTDPRESSIVWEAS